MSTFLVRFAFSSSERSREIIFNSNRLLNGRLRNSPCTSNPLYHDGDARTHGATPTRKRGARPRGKLSRQEASVFTLRPLVERRRTRRKHHVFVSQTSLPRTPSVPRLSRIILFASIGDTWTSIHC